MTKVWTKLSPSHSGTRDSTESTSEGVPTPESSATFDFSFRHSLSAASSSGHALTPRDGSSPSFSFQGRSSSASNSEGISTPRSNNTPRPSSTLVAGNNQGNSGTPVDQVPRSFSKGGMRPSIESNDGDVTGSSSTTGDPHARTPSVSVSPPLAAAIDDLGSINAQVDNMRLARTTPIRGLSDIADAIQVIARGEDSRGSSLLTPTSPSPDVDSPSPRRPRRTPRRSSPRVRAEPHSVEDERPPNDRFNDPTFQRTFVDAKQLMANLGRTLGSSAIHEEPDSTMQRLYRQAGQLGCFQCPSSRVVGLLGDSGVGKSSLLNSLLDRRGLARSTDNGAACTCVVTEFHYRDANDFTVEAELFTMDEVNDQLSNLLQSYRRFHLYDEFTDADERRDFEEKAKIARDTFRAMFRGRFRDENVLLDRTEDEVMGMFSTWMEDDEPWSMRAVNVAADQDECAALLMRLTSESISARGPAVWPYIKKIKVYLRSHILSRGLVLVDLPGLRDSNNARRHITERYILSCDDVFVVCNIGRAVTDIGVKTVIELAQRARLSNVGIICTKSDLIQAEEAIRDWGASEARETQRLYDAVQSDKSLIAIIRDELTEYDGIDDSWYPQDIYDHSRRSQQLLRNENSLRVHQFELDEYLITKRNDNIRRRLSRLYANAVPDGRLEIFFVGNKKYWEHRTEAKDKALPHLRLSGVLGIREHCMAMVSENQYRIAKKYMQDDISALLGETELWVQSGAGTMSAERRQLIRDTLNAVEGRLRSRLCGRNSEVNNVAAMLKGEFGDRIYQRCRNNGLAWSQTARNASYDWNGWHHSTYAAFCRQNGDYCTLAVGARNWNEEAIEAMSNDLAAPWQQLASHIEDHNERLTRVVNDIIDWATAYLSNEIQDEDNSTGVLENTLVSRHRLLVTELSAAYIEVDGKLDILRTDALSGIRTSFIGEAMKDAYRMSCQEHGTGSHARRKAIINRVVQSDRLFRDLSSKLKTSFHALSDVFQDRISNIVSEHTDAIRGTLDIVRSENIAEESERDPEFRARVEEAVRAAKEEMRTLCASLDA
ncbi:hypothetical protein F5Y15DRAFT_423997 [Xylariaceae sp. FL0016]|nr:hypothetical protein F5Y15DRAFT_423997 [Xylariaceae sp. FL0016]